MAVVGNSVLQPFGHFPIKVELSHPLLSNIEITHSSPFYLMNNLIGNSQNIEFVAESNINIYNGDIPVSFNVELNINQDLFAKENLNKTYQINLNKFTTVSNDMEAQISLDYFGKYKANIRTYEKAVDNLLKEIYKEPLTIKLSYQENNNNYYYFLVASLLLNAGLLINLLIF